MFSLRWGHKVFHTRPNLSLGKVQLLLEGPPGSGGRCGTPLLRWRKGAPGSPPGACALGPEDEHKTARRSRALATQHL